MGLYIRCKRYSQMGTCIVAKSEIDGVNIKIIIYHMYKNNISDRWGSYMHIIRGNVGEQRHKKNVAAMYCVRRESFE